ncbi:MULTISPECIES: EAL domain-containing protein [Alphaproteobacteria]|uniref:Diguanylate phosphodiesterase n=2 Tax=Alphaproteobacteria TaxID=28211 RepID=A0A512HEL7_9HYPH|nr:MULTISPECIES: EAL domain-containing protein [Alphaproteobacteria]GEO83901.1 diguanylate phosphodiesterase [Ciceribacter naphthalenivorans]GLR21221.1 diguanylate phosphodiesterase [Ciceribacter naphthalenivorans]GLT04077.1 diguanylate phosphodiesterase [Sphingomonas psychrolutea]
MSTTSIYAQLVNAGGAWSTAYGPFVLRSALQPIFHRVADSVFDIHSFQGLVRAERNGETYPPSQFFPLVDPKDLSAVDSLLRSIHILNAGLLHRERAGVLVSFQPLLFTEAVELRHELDRIRLIAHEANLTPERIICDISAGSGNGQLMAGTVDQLRHAGLRVSMSNYEASEHDIQDVLALRPEFVRFDGDWVRDYLHDSAGFALLRVIVRQLQDEGIEPIFERIEDTWQVDLCLELGVTLLQGYAFARPQLTPTSFNMDYPEMLLPPGGPILAPPEGSGSPTRPSKASGAHHDTMQRQGRVFGKKL